MNSCSNCGALNKSNADVCQVCGLPLSNSFRLLGEESKVRRSLFAKMLAIVILIAVAGLTIYMLMRIRNSNLQKNVQSNEHMTKRETNASNENTVFTDQHLQNIPNAGEQAIDEATLGRITTKITHFINKNNKEDAEAMLEYFHYPIYRYHREYNVSRTKLKKILKNSVSADDEFHFLKPDIANGTVSTNGRNYEVLLNAEYRWGPSASNTTSRKMRLKYVLNKQLEFTSCYEVGK